jgi:hypothetical protein
VSYHGRAEDVGSDSGSMHEDDRFPKWWFVTPHVDQVALKSIRRTEGNNDFLFGMREGGGGKLDHCCSFGKRFTANWTTKRERTYAMKRSPYHKVSGKQG